MGDMGINEASFGPVFHSGMVFACNDMAVTELDDENLD